MQKQGKKEKRRGSTTIKHGSIFSSQIYKVKHLIEYWTCFEMVIIKCIWSISATYQLILKFQNMQSTTLISC